MKKIFLSTLVALLTISSVYSQKTVIGDVTYSYNILGEGAEMMAAMMPEKMVITYGKDGMMVKMVGGMMASAMGTTIVNVETGETYVIKDAEQTVYVQSADEAEAEMEDVENPKPVKHDETMEILGYKCTLYTQTVTMQGMSMTQKLWVTDDLKAPDYDKKALKGMSGMNTMNFDVNGFPLMIEMDIPGMPVTMELKVVNLDLKKVNKSLFEKPKGYTEKSMDEFQAF